MVRNRKTTFPNHQQQPARLSSEDDKEDRSRFFGARSIANTMKSSFQRTSRTEILFLLATHLTVGLLVYSSTVSSPPANSMVDVTNWSINTSPARLRHNQTDIRIDPSHKTQTELFTPVPPEHYKTFFFDGNHREFAAVRALRSRGWKQTDSRENAHLIYSYRDKPAWSSELKAWQRMNRVPYASKWNDKQKFVFYYQKYENRTGKPPSVYVPETYMLTKSKEDIETFRTRLQSENGKNHPWVHKIARSSESKGITILGPNSPDLLALPDESLENLQNYEKLSKATKTTAKEKEILKRMTSIVQKYICNEMTWDGHKFDLRMYWFVASLDPLIVLYHDGYVRVGNSEYSEKSFENTKNHLTTNQGLGAETKKTFSQLEERVNSYGESLDIKFNGTPMEHLRNQFKHALAEFIERFKEESFALPDYESDYPNLSSENSFFYNGADFIVDKDLDVWFIEPQFGPDVNEEYYFLLDNYASLFNGMVDILEEVGRKQEQNQPLLPFEKPGNWEIFYADGYAYKYDGYKRSTNKVGCKVPGSK